ncbi:N,N-dimethylformamidase beta subunit family domain-containing protein [Granulosicoccus antarcticus]|uniref:N,N-dimethylformamidase beta subunit n=1 Tax=Granulosicoccus antarcticus IMCC3135 TaxID=1192854 RepID=A0A2Z2NLZ8_9GAMM|nr:N,N-dimethylformamidase beta subunit family domain-containing protein [Granulosicoccus antarcticus]ASJ71001.1 N,N-dimethylformamidase beta subunit [Granulosicoccus antarcticus IMCC3135]
MNIAHRKSNRCPLRQTCGVLLATLLLFGANVAALAQSQNPVVTENANSGTDAWIITNSANDTDQQIKGYASATSVNKGQSIDFFISVNTTQTYNIDVYRMGWYNGAGGRLMKSASSLNGSTQVMPVYESATGMVSYPWEISYTLAVPASWTSGIYLAKLTNSQGYENYISFVVRDDARTADLLYQQPVTTYQAYNPFPRIQNQTPQRLTIGDEPDPEISPATEIGNAEPLTLAQQEEDSVGVMPTATTLADIGKSLYEYNSSSELTGGGTTRALKVSFDRPYEGWGDGQFFSWEYYLVGWLEKNGYDVAYATDIDLHRNGAAGLQRAKALISAGHDEYWSKAMYDAAEQVRDSGKDIAFLGSNAVYWQIRFAANASGAADRVIICYKSPSLDPETNPALESTRWRDVGRPEQSLVGVQYTTDNEWAFNTDYVVTNSDHWVYAGTGFSDGDTVRGITGYEVDTLYPDVVKPDSQNQTILAASPFTGRDGTSTLSNASIYQAPSGAWVFATGTMSWPWALQHEEFVDARIESVTKNILQRFIDGDPATPKLTTMSFDADTDGFSYLDDAFHSTSNHSHANGYYAPGRGFTGGGIAIRLGGADDVATTNMSGGWRSTFELTSSSNVTMSFRYALSQTPDYEIGAYSEMLLDVDGQLYGTSPNDYIARVSGDGDGGDWPSTNWQTFTIDLGALAAGTHQYTLGGFGNQRSDANENTEILIDDVSVTVTNN